jgi:DNA-binding CsgD family transcriptional regulator/Tfp pilus assembly protein PilF
VLVERERALDALTGLLNAGVAGQGRLVFVGGEAGVGKTALCVEFAEHAAERMSVRRGACDNVTTAAALGPLLDAVPELIDVVESDTNLHRFRLFRQLRDVLTAEPTLLFVDDVHWADEATLDLLRFLGRRLDGLTLLIVATYRTEEVTGSHPLTVVLGDLAAAAGVTRLELSPLSVAGVRLLSEHAASRLDPDELFRSTGGNPFYVTEVLAADDQRIPTTVRDAVLARVTRLSPAARQVLAAAAVLGRPAELSALVAVSGEPAAAVDECVRAGVLVGVDTGWAFRHELARLAFEQSLPPAALVDLHTAALRVLQSLGERQPRRLAHHAASCGDVEAVRRYAPRAAARMARLGAHREAAEQYRLALDFDPDNASVLSALSYEYYLIDRVADAHSAQLAAMELYRQAGDARAVGTAQRWLSRLSWFMAGNAESERFALEAVTTLESLGDDAELALAYSNLAQLRMLAGDTAEAVRWGERALVLARRVGDRDAEIHALNNVGTALALDSEEPEGEQRLAQSLDLALASDSHEHAARAYTNLGTSACMQRRLPLADRHLRAGIAYCADRDLESWRLYMSAWLARSLADQGRYDEAQQRIDDVMRRPHLSAITAITATAVAAQLRARRGEDVAELLDGALALATSTAEAQRLVPVVAARAEARWLAGDTAGIATEIDRSWDAAMAHPTSWELGELRWWLAVGGVRRDGPQATAQPFALMLDEQWRAAADAWRARDCPLWTAIALANDPDLGSAREALEIIDAIGAPAVHQAVLRDRHARGLAVPRGPRATSRANPSGLTARELDVLQLLAEGLSNADVAQALFLSEKTVGHHVSSMLRKLGEPTRSRAVAAALRAGIVTPK